MSFEIDWEDDAIDELARIWMDADDPKLLSAACNYMELQLAKEPFHCGEERSEGLRVWQYGPLRLFFAIDPDKHTVSVS